jgi:hypothetical protein
MYCLYITNKAGNFTVCPYEDERVDDPLTISLNNVTKEFIIGVQFAVDTYVRYAEYVILEVDMLCVNIDNYIVRHPIKDRDTLLLRLATGIREHENCLQSILINSDNKSTGRYIAVIDENNSSSLIHFNSIDSLNGMLTFMKINASSLKTSPCIRLIYDNKKLCRHYIKHNIKADCSVVERAISHLYIVCKDVIAIIMEYYPDTCKHQGWFSSKHEFLKYKHCETLCDFGREICRVCKGDTHGNTYSASFRTSVRVESVID